MPKKDEPAPTLAEMFAAFIDGLVQNHTITADTAGLIKHAIAAKKEWQ